MTGNHWQPILSNILTKLFLRIQRVTANFSAGNCQSREHHEHKRHSRFILYFHDKTFHKIFSVENVSRPGVLFQNEILGLTVESYSRVI